MGKLASQSFHKIRPEKKLFVTIGMAISVGFNFTTWAFGKCKPLIFTSTPGIRISGPATLAPPILKHSCYFTAGLYRRGFFRLTSGKAMSIIPDIAAKTVGGKNMPFIIYRPKTFTTCLFMHFCLFTITLVWYDLNYHSVDC